MTEPTSEEVLASIRGQRKLLDAMKKIAGPDYKSAATLTELQLYASTLDLIACGAVDPVEASKVARQGS